MPTAPAASTTFVALTAPASGAFDLTVEAAKTAAQISADMLLSNDRERQRTLSNLGEYLRNALPVSTLDAQSNGSQPILADEFLPYVGDCKDFFKTLKTDTMGNQQRPPVVAVLQASGSGKTRLAYEAGMHGWFVVLIRLTDGSLCNPSVK